MAKDKKSSKRRSIFSGSGLEEATKRSYDMKDSSGYGPKYLKDGVKFSSYFPKDGTHTIDIVPYIAGANDPNCAEGKPQYVLDVWVHMKVGALQNSFICPAKNFRKRCPICEKQMEMRKSGDFTDEEIKELSPKRRTLYNVVSYDSKEETKKGVQIWEVAHFFFENHIAEISRRPKTGGFIPFSHPDEGKSVHFKIAKKGQNSEYLGHRFEDRDEPISDEILDAAYVLDEMLHIPTLSELKQAVIDGFADSDSDDDDDEKPAKKSSKVKPSDDDDDNDDNDVDDDIDEDADDDDDDDEDEKPKKGKKSSKKSKDEDEDDDDDDIPEDDDDDDEDEKPAKKKRKYDDDDADDDDDDDEDEKPKKSSKKSSSKKPPRR